MSGDHIADAGEKVDPSAQGPAELFLQLHGDCQEHELTEPVDYTNDEVTWCWHRIHGSDVRYVRADLVADSGFLRWALDTLIELNPSNYDHEDACACSSAAVEVMLAIKVRLDPAHPAPVAVVPAEQAEDSAMLDWLDKNNARFQMGWRVGIAPAGNASIQSVIQLGGQPLTSIRAAIRAAIGRNREAGGS